MELDRFDLPKTESNIEVKKQIEHEFKLIGSARHTPGLTLYAVNTKTGEIHPAEYVKDSTVSFAEAAKMCCGQSQHTGVRRKVQVEKDCIYIEALNLKSANQKMIKAWKRAMQRTMDDIQM